jgi:hypothetical protein
MKGGQVEIDPTKWYVISSQGIEKGPYDTYKEAKVNCDNCCYEPMFGEQILDTFDDIA